MTKPYKIQSKRQDNDLWGMPLKLKSIDGGVMFKNEEENKLFSAIIMAFSENHTESFWLKMENKFFTIHTDSNVYNYSLSYFGLDDDMLYFLSTDDDKKMFNRMIKLKKLKI